MPCNCVKPPSGEHRQPYAMTEKEVNVFLSKLESHRLYALYFVAVATWKEYGLVFSSEVGTPISPRNLLRHFKQALKRAFLPENLHEATDHQRYLTTLRFHDLRHTAGSLMLAAGVPMVDVSKLLGHSSVAVTAAIYAHSYEDNKRKAVAAVTKY